MVLSEIRTRPSSVGNAQSTFDLILSPFNLMQNFTFLDTKSIQPDTKSIQLGVKSVQLCAKLYFS